MKLELEFDPTLSLLKLIVLILSLAKIPNSIGQNEACRQTFECGRIREIGYPFSGGDRPDYCGYPGFRLTCIGNILRLNISSISYRVLNISNNPQTLRIARDDLSRDLCPMLLVNTTLNFSIFDFNSDNGDQNVTLLYNCGSRGALETPQLPNQFSCNVNNSNTWGYYLPALIGEWENVTNICGENITVPVNGEAARTLEIPAPGSLGVLQQALAEGFWIRWRADDDMCSVCLDSGGSCGRDRNSGSFACYCRNGTRNSRCNDTRSEGAGNNNSNSRSGIRIGLPIGGAVLAGIGVGWLIFHLRQRRKQKADRLLSPQPSKDLITTPSSKPLASLPSTNFSENALSFTTTSNSDLGWGSTYYGAQVFDYAELEEATANFDPSRVLGDGGFGTVYYGKLSDGRVVAVKRLYENNFKRVEQFVNEVKILTGLRHKNLVSLYGCTSHRSPHLLLVYEFVPNGTVADHLHGRRPALLPWPVRLNIAIETAEALHYLHNSVIVHRDVKTNNILLDSDFHVKVADFGLSRLFPNDVTHVSTAPQGTPGYVDPEYYQCYQLTEKSDVYSFGVVLVELLSSLVAVDTNRHRQDINLASMAVNKIQNRALDELVDPSLGFGTDQGVRRAVMAVAELAFRCLQQEREMRPTMGEVMETLKRIRDEGLGGGYEVEVVDLKGSDEAAPLREGVETPESGSGQNSSG